MTDNPIEPTDAATVTPSPNSETDSPWRVLHAIGIYVVAAFLSTIAQVIVFAVAFHGADIHKKGLQNRFAVIIAGQMTLALGLFIGPWVISKVRTIRRPYRSLGLGIRLWPDVPLGIACGAIAQAFVGLVYWPLDHWFPSLQHQTSKQAHQFFDHRSGIQMLVLGLSLAILVPIAEETLFRGVLLRGLRRLWGDKWAIVGSAVIFGLAHAAPAELLGLIPLGALLAVLAVRTGRLGPGIVTHGTFNAITVIVWVAGHH